MEAKPLWRFKRDRLMQGAEDMAREEWEKTKSVAKETAAAVQAEVEKGGPPAETAERAAKSGVRTAQQSASDKGIGGSDRKAD